MIELVALASLATALFRDRQKLERDKDRWEALESASKIILGTYADVQSWSKKQAMNLKLGKFSCPNGHTGPFSATTVATYSYEGIRAGDVHAPSVTGQVVDLYYSDASCDELLDSPDVFHCDVCKADFTVPRSLYTLQSG
jgi:hypothetical protein